MSTTSEPLVALAGIRGVRVAFGGIEVVKGIDLDLVAGEVHAIIGENGAGKSTVAKVIAGVQRPTQGTVLVNGAECTLDGPREGLARGIALIHQEPLTFPDLDVTENIFVGHHPTRGRLGIDWPTARHSAADLMASLGLRLDPRARVGGLSVADQQMVELAAALSHDANVFIFDETTASLTPQEVGELFTIIRRLKDRGCAIAFVSHHLDEVMEIADRITVLRDGERVAERRPADTSIDEIVRLMVGRETASSAPRDRAPTGDPILIVTDLASAPRFAGVNFELRRGEILGFGGLVGAGRTDVCRALFGAAPVTAGEIWLDGEPLRLRSPREAMARGIALVPEDRQHDGLMLPMPISTNAVAASLARLFRGGRWRSSIERTEATSAVDSVATTYRTVEQPVRELSGGNQQKVVLAKWLMTKPRILILDEPTRGVDVGAKAEVHRLIQDLVREGLSIILVSSDLPELLALSDRIVVMRTGRQVATLSRAEASPEAVMLAATGQEATPA